MEHMGLVSPIPIPSFPVPVIASVNPRNPSAFFPAEKNAHHDGKSPFLMGKSTINAPFSRAER